MKFEKNSFKYFKFVQGFVIAYPSIERNSFRRNFNNLLKISLRIDFNQSQKDDININTRTLSEKDNFAYSIGIGIKNKNPVIQELVLR